MYVLYLQDLGRASNKTRKGGVKGNCASSVSSPSSVRDETESVSDRSEPLSRPAQLRRDACSTSVLAIFSIRSSMRETCDSNCASLLPSLASVLPFSVITCPGRSGCSGAACSCPARSRRESCSTIALSFSSTASNRASRSLVEIRAFCTAIFHLPPPVVVSLLLSRFLSKAFDGHMFPAPARSAGSADFRASPEPHASRPNVSRAIRANGPTMSPYFQLRPSATRRHPRRDAYC